MKRRTGVCFDGNAPPQSGLSRVNFTHSTFIKNKQKHMGLCLSVLTIFMLFFLCRLMNIQIPSVSYLQYSTNATVHVVDNVTATGATDRLRPMDATNAKLQGGTDTGGPNQLFNQTEQVQLIKANDLITSHATIVTAYFRMKSKHSHSKYEIWMANMLSMQDAMVIFTEPDFVETITVLRSHAQNRTVIYPINLTQVDVAQKYDLQFWQQHFEKDPEKHIHQSYEVFWVWLSKSWFVSKAIALNHELFQSDIFMWSDIGCFREGSFRHKELILHTELIPKDRILQMAHQTPMPPKNYWWDDKLGESRFFYHSGSQAVGYTATWLQFHREFMITFEGMIFRGMFIGDDQVVMQCTCLRVPSLCAYVPTEQVQDNNYFGLRRVLHHGGSYRYWYPPSRTSR